MKKRMVLISVILFIGLITSLSIASSFAKYKHEETFTDKVRVAKWDIKLETIDIDLFKDSNESGSVKSVNGDKVIAPGSKGEYNFTIVGAPETRYRLKVEAKELNEPTGKIKFKLDDVCSFTNVKELNRCLQRVYSPTVEYEANESISEEDEYHTISWEWVDDGKPNESDTELGSNAITNKDQEGYNDQVKVSLVINVEAEQVTAHGNATKN